VRQLDGVAGFLQANAIEFNDRSRVPEMVASEVRRRGWLVDWYNGLRIEVNTPPFRDATIGGTNVQGRFFHLAVKNGHVSRRADQCVAYLDSVVYESTGNPLPFDTVEFKWAGFTFPYAGIAAQGHRLLDAFWVLHSQPSVLQFNAFTDSTQFTPRVLGPGRWLVNFSVTSSSVRGAQASFKLQLGSTLHDIYFEPINQSA
jgi:hypothetical protein